MRHLGLGVVFCLAMSVLAGVAAADPQMMAPIEKFIESFNKGDVAGAAAAHAATEDLAIIDEVPPYLWRGPQAFQTWVAALGSDSEKRGITDQVVTISAPVREESNGEAAYIVVPAVYAFKEGGVAMREAAQMTFALKKGSGGWLIHGWVWTGPKPEPVAPTKP